MKIITWFANLIIAIAAGSTALFIPCETWVHVGLRAVAGVIVAGAVLWQLEGRDE